MADWPNKLAFIAGSVSALTLGAGVTAVLWSWRKSNKDGNAYETERLVNQYMAFHYSPADEYFAFDIGPKEDVDFPKRCAELCVRHKKDDVLNRALDIGCAVGRASFELARSFDEVVGIDFSHAFVARCNEMKYAGLSNYVMPDEGELGLNKVARVAPDIDRSRVTFAVGDACDLSPSLNQFGCVLAANLVCRLPDPMAFLNQLPQLVVPGGIVVMTTPYSWLEEYTPKDKWLGGYVKSNGEAVTGFTTLKAVMEPHFELESAEDFPLVIKETARKHQWTAAHATVWRRKP